MYDMSECLGVLPGKMCAIRCQYPYLGISQDLTCPIANTDPDKMVQGDLPDCGCQEPSPLPPGYIMTVDEIDLSISYSCDTGYVGKAEKLCKAGSGSTCTVDPIMVGCAIALSCEALWEDHGSSAGVARGHLTFGPAMKDGTVSEDGLLGYEVYWADDCEDRTGQVLGEISLVPVEERETCCRGDVYSVEVDAAPPSGAIGFTIISVLPSGHAPLGVFVPLDFEVVNKAVVDSFASARKPAWTSLALTALAAWTMGFVQRRDR